ncbi:MAG: hypothetical protein M0Z66_08615 [Thermaerobacter sp.]|nr:hypothetical protein [Thermaerobacter sp.]
MVFDLAIRTLGYGFLAVSLLVTPNHVVHWWTFDFVACSNAVVFMATSAGGPNLWPRLVPSSAIGQAIQAEQIGWNVGTLLGPLSAGLLINLIGLPAIVTLTAVVFGLTAFNLATVPLKTSAAEESSPPPAIDLAAVWARVRGEQALWLTTVVFWTTNLVSGFLAVLWPLIVQRFWHGSVTLYGALLTVESVGGLVGSMSLAGWTGRGSLLRRVLIGELAAGLAMLLLLPGLMSPTWSFVALFASSAIGVSTATWVLRLRFDLIREAERPPMLAYIRTALHTAAPIGGLLAGILWRPAWAPVLLAASVAVTTFPSMVGLLVSRHSRHPSVTASRN